MDGFVKVGQKSDFREGRGRAVRVDGVAVAVFRTGEGFVAFTDACPHMGASLADGRIHGGVVECAWHGWRFDLRTGRNAFKEWAAVTVYEVRIEGEDVLVRRPDIQTPPPAPAEEEWPLFDPDRHLKKR